MVKEWRLLVSCEHGGNQVPPSYDELFHGHEELLRTHRGYDIGILPFARRLALELKAPLHAAETTRLLVDLNRSVHSPALFSAVTRNLNPVERQAILRCHYHPYRRSVAAAVSKLLAAGSGVIHVSVHSFTPTLEGRERQADIGLLYDPQREPERKFCRLWQQAIRRLAPELRVRLNYPYRGVSDSLVKALRNSHPVGNYAGLEIEINQKYPLGGPEAWDGLQKTLVESLRRHPQLDSSNT